MTKKRISLTIDESLLKRADRLVGVASDSRSGVFEVLLKKAIVSMVPKTAVILVGSGKEAIFMKEFKGKKTIDHHIDNMGLAGVTRFIIIGDALDEIKGYLKGRDGEFRFVNDKESGTAGALKEAAHLLDNTFFLVYGDIVSGVDYRDLYQFHMDNNVMATIALTTASEPQKFGIPEMKGTKVIGFKEKPSRAKSHLVSSGSFVIEPEVLELIQPGNVSLEKKILPKLASLNQLAGYLSSGTWVDVGTLD